MPETSKDTTSLSKASTRKIAEAKLEFENLIKEINLKSALKELDKAVSLGPFSVRIGFRAWSPKRPAHHIAYVQCETTPRDLKPNTVSGWKKQEGGWWEYSTAGKTVDVRIIGRDTVELQAVVGACISTQRSKLTQGLVVRNQGDGMRWGINVGHGFVLTAQADPGNHVAFCDPGHGVQCQFCVAGQCGSCLNGQVPVSLAAHGVDEVKTTNPKPAEADDDSEQEEIRDIWLDMGVYKIAAAQIVQPLAVRNVQNNMANLPQGNQGAIAAITGLTGVSGSRISQVELEDNAAEREVYLFKKGISSGWTFGKLDTVFEKCFTVSPLGASTNGGDCGAIWFVIEGVNARPAGYHVSQVGAGTPDAELEVHAYWAAWPAFTTITGIQQNNIGFVSADSYVW